MARRDFLKLKTKVTIIQSLVRRNNALKLAKRLRHERDVTIKVQRRWRAVLLARNVRSEYLKIRNSIIIIQTKWRATKLACEERNRFIQMKKSVVIIQSLVRRNSALKLADRLRHEHDVIIQRNKAAFLIQV